MSVEEGDLLTPIHFPGYLWIYWYSCYASDESNIVEEECKHYDGVLEERL